MDFSFKMEVVRRLGLVARSLQSVHCTYQKSPKCALHLPIFGLCCRPGSCPNTMVHLAVRVSLPSKEYSRNDTGTDQEGSDDPSRRVQAGVLNHLREPMSQYVSARVTQSYILPEMTSAGVLLPRTPESVSPARAAMSPDSAVVCPYVAAAAVTVV
jgi:hypothetical protein